MAIAAAIASVIGAGVGIGQTIYNDVSAPGAPPPAPGAPPPKPPDANALANLKRMVGSADSNTQAQTSGTAGDFYRFIQDQLQAGTLGQPGSAGAAQSTVYGQQPQQQPFTPANNQITNAAVNGTNLTQNDIFSQ